MLLFCCAVTTALVLSFLCSLAEAVLLSTTHAQIEQLAGSGSRAGPILRRFKQRPDVPIAAILALNTFAHTGGAAVAGMTFAEAFPDVGELWFVAGFTVAVLLLTEIVPKTLGVTYHRPLAAKVAHGVDWLVRVMHPFVLLTNLFGRMVSRQHSAPVTSLEEIRLLATAGRSHGLFGSLTAGIIENATRLRELRARDVMVPRSRVSFLCGAHAIEDTLAVVRQSGHSRFPFTLGEDLNEVCGIVLAKELLFHLRERTEPDWQELLVPLLVVPEMSTLNHVLRAFQREKRHMAIVVDEYGVMQGLITLEDVLEEIVGEIEDETDSEETSIQQRADGSLHCRGAAEVRKVFARLGIADLATDSQTLSGFLAEQLGTVPFAGAVIEHGRHRFTVLRASNRRAERVRIDRLPPQEQDDGA